MPQRKFRMFLASKNTQTTAYHRFHATRQTNPNFQMNGGCCGNRNPLKGWRKEKNVLLELLLAYAEGGGGVDTRRRRRTVFGQFDQTTNVSTFGTLLKAGDTYGIFEMSDCNSAFSALG